MVRHIKSLLPTLVRPQEDWKFYLLNNWQEVVGNLGNTVTLEKIDGSILTLGVPNSCWLQELHMLAPVLIETINQKLDQPRISALRFKRMGSPKEKNKREVPQHAPEIKKQCTPNARQQKALDAVTDPGLRAALERFLARCHEGE